MSSATKRKHVTREVEQDFSLPAPHQIIVQVVAGRGNNLHEVRDEVGHSFLVSMPTKFRKNVWIKRGDFVIVNPIDEGDKVKAEICTILYKEQIKYIKSEKLWPEGFGEAQRAEQRLAELRIQEDSSGKESEDSEDDSDLFQNTNRPVRQEETEESDSSESED